jgi:hypothetical protein
MNIKHITFLDVTQNSLRDKCLHLEVYTAMPAFLADDFSPKMDNAACSSKMNI